MEMSAFTHDPTTHTATATFRTNDREILLHAQEGMRRLPDVLATRISDLVMAEQKDALLAAITPELIAAAVQKAVTEIGTRLIFEHVRKAGGKA